MSSVSNHELCHAPLKATCAAWTSPGSTSAYIGYRDGSIMEWDFRMPTDAKRSLFSAVKPAPGVGNQDAAITSITTMHGGKVVVGSQDALRVYVSLAVSFRCKLSWL
jgi:hypothetical protein